MKNQKAILSIYKVLIVLLTLLSIVSCRKELGVTPNEQSNITVDNMSNLKVPAGFKWEMSRSVKFKITTNDTRFKGYVHRLEIWTKSRSKLSSGTITNQKEFESTIEVPTNITSVYLVKIAPDGSKIEQSVDLSSGLVIANISPSSNKSLSKSSGPDCSTGCNTVENNPSGNKTYTTGTTCLTGNINISNITLQGDAKVKICGTGTIGNFNFNGSSNSSLTITSTGDISCGSTIPVQTNLIVYGKLKTTGNNEHINVNSNSTFTNYGIVETSGNFNPNGQSVIVNNGTIIVGAKLQNSSGANFTNNCKLIIVDNFDNNGLFNNYGYVRCSSETTIQGGANNEFKQFNGAMLSTKDIQVNGTIFASGVNNSLIKVSGKSKGNSNGLISGTHTYCDLNGIEGPWNANFSSSASQSCNLYIPTNDCNPEGNGVNIVDTDGDGVSDSTDDYPNNANLAYNNRTTTSTLAFEDLWPYKGDYDMNDIVVDYTYNIITNASNIVARVEASYILRATGGSNSNGFGIEFPINRSLVSGLSGATLEANQSKAVIIIFNNSRSEMQTWNTIQGQAKISPITYQVSFNINNGPTLSSFGLSSYNPFIWNASSNYGRGHEIHLPGKNPTELANSTLFKTGHDNTNLQNSVSYVTKEGYPWALNIPTSFDYPYEKKDINIAYNKFAAWVTSSGSQFQDWYSNLESYRNDENIYK